MYIPFMRRLFAACVTLALAGSVGLSAQHRAAQSRTARPPATPPASPGPSATDRWISGLRFTGRRGEPERRLVPPLRFLWGWEPWVFDATAPIALPALPADTPVGGVQLDIQPWRAQVYLDGVLVGRVEDFKGYYHHLDVAAGQHQLVILEPGFQPLILDIVVPAGRTSTYRGTLSEALSR